MVAGRDVDQGPAGSAYQGGGDREQSVAQSFWFPASGLVVGVGEQSHPGGDLTGQGDDLAPDPVLVEPVQRQIRQPGVLRITDPILTTGPTPMPHFQVGQLAAGGVGHEPGQPIAVNIVEAQLCAGTGPLAANNDPHVVDGSEDLTTALRLVRGRPFDQLRPNGWAWLVDTGEQHHMAAAVADVAHTVATHHLQTHQLHKARHVTEAALLAVPDDYNLQADLLEITMAEGHPEIALRMYQEMCNQPDGDGIPAEVGARIDQVLAKLDWKRAARAS